MSEILVSDRPDLCEVLPWDTDFFGFRIARVCVQELTTDVATGIDAWANEHAIACLYFLARADDMVTTRCAEDHHYHLVDIRLTLARKLSPGRSTQFSDLPSLPQGMRNACPSDLSRLQAIARSAHARTRFFRDTAFPLLRSQELYACWITKSFLSPAAAVLVAEVEGNVAGYVTCSLDSSTHRGAIGLLGVDSEHRCKGIGSSLLNGALTWFAGQGAEAVTVVTQGGNCGAQRLYQSAGFVTSDAGLWYHKWFCALDIAYEDSEQACANS